MTCLIARTTEVKCVSFVGRLQVRHDLRKDKLPQEPPAARLPEHFRSRQPAFLDPLTRSTLPTASLSYDDPLGSPSYNHAQHRSSVDTLRAVRDRGMPPPQPPVETMKPSWWWFQTQNKEAVDEMLDEEDRGESVEDEQAKIRQKCRPFITLIVGIQLIL